MEGLGIHPLDALRQRPVSLWFLGIGDRMDLTSLASRAALGIAISLVCVACGGTGTSSTTPLPLVAIETPPTTPEPTSTAQPKPLSVKITKRTTSVRHNANASVTVKTAKGARCSISVEYASGYATAAGLGDKKANASGVVTWKWKVGGRTTTGRWPIDILCDLGNRSGHASTSFVVR